MREKLIAGLLACGWVEQATASRKYRMFTRSDKLDAYFVGKSAALRKGRNASTSISISDTITRDAYIKVGGMASSLTTSDQANATFEMLIKQRRVVAKVPN